MRLLLDTHAFLWFVTDDPNLSPQAEAAFRKASESVVRQARQTGTPILIWEDGQIRQVSADRLETTEPPYTPVAPVHMG